MSGGSRFATFACYLAIFAVGENSTAIMALLPSLSTDLGLDSATVEWVVNAYLLAAAAFIILGGRAADGFGPRLSSAAGIAVFALASVIIALAPTGTVVVVARALQGLGAAFAVAGTLAAVSATAPDASRAGAISAWTGFLMLGFSLGPLIGGIITHEAGWRANFWINLLVMAPAAVVLGLSSDGVPREKASIDVVGLALLALFMVTLILGLHALPRAALWAGLLPLVLAALAFAGLYRWERGRKEPLLDFAMFANQNFAIAALLAFLVMFDIMTLLLYYNLFAQASGGLGMSPLEAGLSLLPLSIALFGFARAAPRLAASLGLKRVMAGGALLLVLGCAIAWASLGGAGLPLLLLGLFATGAGITLPFASSSRVGLAALPPEQAGRGSGVLNASSFLGATVGTTIGGIVFADASFRAVLLLLMVPALIAAALSLRLRLA